MLFRDRYDAGRRLAVAVAQRHPVNPVVVALPRGGVPVGREVARELHAPLDVLLVRKIGDPMQPELAVAAMAEGSGEEHGDRPGRPFELEVRQDIGESMDEAVTQQWHEIERRRALWLHGRPHVPVTGRTVIVVDDGIATGTTLRAALKSLRGRGPSRIVVAVPVAPLDEIERLREEVDEVVCLATPEPFGAVGRFYDHFDQVTDDEVTDMLAPAPAHAR